MNNISRNQLLVGSFTLLFAVFPKQGAFAQTPPPNVKFLHAFTGGSAGADPVTPVIQTPDGGLVGVTYGAGLHKGDGGTLYKFSPTGQFSVLHQFPADGSEGGVYDRFHPASIMQASDQNFYGTFPNYGQTNAGTIYRVTPKGVYNQIHDFAGDGFQPFGPLVEGFDSNLYGVSGLGPGRTPGAIFRVGLDGSFAYVNVFGDAVQNPDGGLALGPDGSFYGLAQTTFYRFDPIAKAVTALASVLNADIVSSLLPVIGPDNRAYFSDTTAAFCNCPGGAIVSLGLDGSGIEYDYLFTLPGTAAAPSLMLAGDGNFYTAGGFGSASYAQGVNLTKQSVSSYSLQGIGSNLNGSLTQISNGSLAGTTYGGGDGGAAAGTLFLLNASDPKPAPVILGFAPSIAGVGETVTIWGSYLIGTTAVSIGGISTSFKTASSGFVSFAVPAGAKTGGITITNAGGSSTSTGVLTVN